MPRLVAGFIRRGGRGRPMKQPQLGLSASALIIVLSLLVIRALGTDLFMGWASYALMGAIPFAIVVGAFWKGAEPGPIAQLPQPGRGIAYLLLAAAVAAVVSWVHWSTRGGSASPPVPMAVMTIITSVVTTFFMVIVLGGWPFDRIGNRLLGGVGLLVSAYLVNALIFQLAFDYGFASGAPFYAARLDPGGLFNAWDVVVVMVSALAVMFAFLFLDLWPLNRIASPAAQPAFGLLWLASCFAIGLLIFWFGTAVAGLPAPTFMVRVPIPFIFGSILLLNMLGGTTFAGMAQPGRGLAGIVLAMVAGSALAYGYAALMPVLSGPLPAGPDGGFAAEVWLANALLAVTFPLLAFFGDFFGLWPLSRAAVPARGGAAA